MQKTCRSRQITSIAMSPGSIEYWPDPQRAIAEAYRVIKPGGIALIIGPLRRQNPVARWLSDTWMRFPGQEDYLRWYLQAGFTDINQRYSAPAWYEDTGNPYGIAIAGVKPEAGQSPLALEPIQEVKQPITPKRLLVFSSRLLIGSVAGAMFIPIAIYYSLKGKLKRQPQD